ncbi:uncharacterized protein LOC118356405 [Zalophus californianus]|uniref:Uncharacterized protein LOC118356405 n=1 Tax=Zalophus californianus TaxID=9704 RepID=A0A6P9FHZ1_ZALCA|nr:uncharacterized protein LOC118356405 [Zalophus californianus]
MIIKKKKGHDPPTLTLPSVWNPSVSPFFLENHHRNHPQGPPRPVILLLGKYQWLAYHPHQADEVRASHHTDQVFSPGILDVKPPRGFPATPHTSLRTPCSRRNPPTTSPNPCPIGPSVERGFQALVTAPPTPPPSPRPQDVAHSPGGLGHLVSSHLALTTFPKDSVLLISIPQVLSHGRWAPPGTSQNIREARRLAASDLPKLAS